MERERERGGGGRSEGQRGGRREGKEGGRREGEGKYNGKI